LDLNRLRALALTLILGAVVPATALAQSPPVPVAGTGGVSFPPAVPAPITTAAATAKLLPDGTAAAPAGAPIAVQNAIFAANRIQHKPYVYGGGHASFRARGYDCSGTVSYALHGASLLSSPLDSSGFMHWGVRGPGQWITVYSNPGHAFVVIAGLRLDTSRYGVVASRRVARSALESGPRWRPTERPSRGFRVRHPDGL
jgi:cell wall-associated NlpC family hydrolase